MARSSLGNVPVGIPQPLATDVLPPGALFCHGDPVAILDYPRLYATIGTRHGDGSTNADGTASGFAGTHFNLPDIRGVGIRGVDGTAGRDPDKLTRTAAKAGGATGNNVGSYQADDFASHSHQIAGPASGANVANYRGASSGLLQQTATSGGNETRGKNIAMEWIIYY